MSQFTLVRSLTKHAYIVRKVNLCRYTLMCTMYMMYIDVLYAHVYQGTLMYNMYTDVYLYTVMYMGVH